MSAPPPPPTTATGPAPETSASPGGASHRIQLDAYAGPLDLLLYLVKRHEIDLQDIPMAELVEQYMAHLRVIETIDVEKAGEFLVMAATLVEIKSQLLVPRPAEEQDDEAGDQPEADPAIDPRFELVQQLLAYKRFKDAANALESRAAEWEVRFPVHARVGEAQQDEPDETEAKPIELDLEDVNVLDLCAAFGRVMDSIGHLGDHEVTYDDTPISLHAEDIVDRIQRDGGAGQAMTLPQLFQGRTRSEMIGLFLATLELVRQRKVKVTQDEAAGQIALALQPESAWETDEAGEPEASPDWRDPETGEVQYDWPDEQTRRRAERRERFRKTWESKQDTPEENPADGAQPGSESADAPSTTRDSDGWDATDDNEDPQGEAGDRVVGEVDEFQDADDDLPPRPSAD